MSRKLAAASVVVAVFAFAAFLVLLPARSDREVPRPAAPEAAMPAAAAPPAPGDEPLLDPVDLSTRDRERDVFGTVRDRSGAPVAGARIATFHAVDTGRPLIRLFETADFSGLPPGPATRSAADGSFGLALHPAETIHLVAEAAGFLDAFATPVRAGSRVDLVLLRPEDGPEVSLEALDDTGAVVTGAAVSAIQWRSGSLAAARAGQTDGEGHALLAGLLPGVGMFTIRHEDYRETTFTVFLPESGRHTERVVLTTAPAAAGIVVDRETGAPIAGAVVTAGPAGRRRVTGEDGRFSFPNFSREVEQVWARAPGYAFASCYPPYEGETVISLPPALAIRGRLVDAEGRPVAGGGLRLNGAVEGDIQERYAMIDLSATSGEDGTFLFPDAREGGSYTLIAAAASLGRRILPVDPASLPGPARDKDLGDVALAPGRTVRGFVLTPEGEPAPGLWVRAGGVGRAFTDLRALTDDIGRFLFTGVAPGEILLETEPGTSLPARAKLTVEESADPPETILRLPGGRSLEVQVLSPDGQPLPGASVVASWPGDGAMDRTDSNGRVLFRGFPDEVYEVDVDVRPAAGHTDPVIFRTTWTVPVDMRSVTIRLRPVAWLAGVCVDPDGNPLPGAGVRVQTAGGELAGVSGAADRHGRFKLMCAEGGVVNLGFQVSAMMPPAAKIYGEKGYRAFLYGVTAPRENMRVVLSPVLADRMLTVKVLDGENRPVAGAAVRAEGILGTASGVTGEDGRVVIEGVEDGVVFLLVTPRPGTVSPLAIVPYREIFDVCLKTDVIVRFRPGEIVVGTVCGPDGRPVEGARVPGARGPTDAEGKYEILVPAGERPTLTATWTDATGAWHMTDTVPDSVVPPGIRSHQGKSSETRGALGGL